MSELLEAALKYREQGLHPIPCEPRGKRPLVPWKDYQDRQPSVHELECWWTETPDANIGLVLGRGMFAVDVDSAEGAQRLLDAGISLPEFAPRSTTGKGYHVFLAGASPDRVGVVPGVDIRGVGYVVAPPSIHPTGKRYAWAFPYVASMLPSAPEQLLALVHRPVSAASASPADGSSWVTSAWRGVGEGQRDTLCTRLAGYYLGKGVPQDCVQEMLLAWAERCDPPFPAQDVAKCVESIAKREGEPAAPPSDISVILPGVLKSIRSPLKKTSATELGELDNLLDGGFYPGLIILGARPSIGKTAFALQVCRAAGKRGVGSLIVSREMSKGSIVRRMLAQESYVRATALKTGNLTEIEWALVDAGAARLAKMPIQVTDSAITIEHIATTLASYDPGTFGLVVVDYLQMVRGPAGMHDKRAVVEYVAAELKHLAVMHSVPILCLSSLSRPERGVANWRPTLSNLRESGELEHAADDVILMHRDSLEDPSCEVEVAKQRDGRVGKVHLNYKGEFLTFTEAK